MYFKLAICVMTDFKKVSKMPVLLPKIYKVLLKDQKMLDLRKMKNAKRGPPDSVLCK